MARAAAAAGAVAEAERQNTLWPEGRSSAAAG
jgi:hypothetical protein